MSAGEEVPRKPTLQPEGVINGAGKGLQPKGLPPPDLKSAERMIKEPAGQLLSGPKKDPSFLIGVKLDLEAEVVLQARVRGDITVGLY